MIETILIMVQSRLNFTPKQQAEYLRHLINAAIEELAETGIHIRDNYRDTMFVVNVVVWKYQNRDKASAMPEWLAQERRERYLQEARDDT